MVVDGGRGRLLRGRRVDHGRIHLEELESLENHPDEHEHGRPSPRSRMGGNTYASTGHEGEHNLHRFAKDVAAWIERTFEGHAVEELTLFSAPRFLGELRKLVPAALAARIREHQADLTQVSTATLAKHPAIEQLFG